MSRPVGGIVLDRAYRFNRVLFMSGHFNLRLALAPTG